jgi:hypothetical protein
MNERACRMARALWFVLFCFRPPPSTFLHFQSAPLSSESQGRLSMPCAAISTPRARALASALSPHWVLPPRSSSFGIPNSPRCARAQAVTFFAHAEFSHSSMLCFPALGRDGSTPAVGKVFHGAWLKATPPPLGRLGALTVHPKATRPARQSPHIGGKWSKRLK